MKVNMEFNLPADNYAYQHAMNGEKYHKILSEFLSHIKWCEKIELPGPPLEELKKYLLELYAENNVNP